MVESGERDIVEVETAPEDDGELIKEEAVDQALEAQLRGELEAVERAEKRLEEGTYGLSETVRQRRADTRTRAAQRGSRGPSAPPRSRRRLERARGRVRLDARLRSGFSSPTVAAGRGGPGLGARRAGHRA